MIPHLFRYAAITVALTGVAVASPLTTHVARWVLPDTPGASFVSLTDSAGTPLNAPGIIGRESCVAANIVADVAMQCGDLQITHPLPSVRVLGKTRTPTLLFNSQHAHPHPLISLDVAVPAGTTLPDSIVYVTSVSGTPRDSETVNGALLSTNLAIRRRIQVGWDAFTFATGEYAVTITARSYYSGTPISASVTTQAIVVNRIDSPIGLGWSVAGMDRLYLNRTVNANGRLWVGGDGSARVFDSVATHRWVARAYDRPDTLSYDTTTTLYTRTLHGGAKEVFNAQGQHIQTVDARGFATVLQYQSTSADAPLAYLFVPKLATAYFFEYTISGADTTLHKVYSPGPVVASTFRVTNVTVAGSQILAIQDPDGTAVSYDLQTTGPATNAIKTRTDRRGTVSRFVYDAHVQLAQATTDMVSPARVDTVKFCAVFALVSPNNSCMAPRLPYASNAIATIDGPRLDADALDVMQYAPGRFGAPSFTRDALGHETHVLRADAGFPLFVTQTTTADGTVRHATADARGNLATETVDNALGNGYSQTTTYTWDARWDKPTSIVDNLSNTTFLATYDTHSNAISIADGRTGSATAFTYGTGSSTDSLLLLTATPPATRGVALDRDSLAYDALGNPIASYSLTDSTGTSGRFNAASFYANDAIGRNTITCQSITTVGGAPQCTTVTLDLVGHDLETEMTGPTLNGAPAEAVTVRKYFDEEGNVDSLTRQSSTGPLGVLATRWTYDLKNRQTSETGPDGNTELRIFDESGNMVSKTNRRGDVVTMRYDALNRLTERDVPQVIITGHPDTTLVSDYPWSAAVGFASAFTMQADTYRFYYDAMSRLESAFNDSTRVRRSYYPNGMLNGDTVEVRRAQGDSVRYGLVNTYDALNRRTALIMPAALTGGDATMHFGYDAITNALTTVTEPLGHAWSFTYNLRGEETGQAPTIGPAQTLTYDGAGRVSSDYLNRSTAVLRSNKFSYDLLSKLTGVRDASGFTEMDSLTYTGLGHLLQSSVAQTASNGATASGYGATNEVLTQDALGNPLSRTTASYVVKCVSSGGGGPISSSGCGTESASATTVDTLDSFGRLKFSISNAGATTSATSTYHYDENGDVVYYLRLPTSNLATAAGREARYSFYDAEGRLRAADYRTTIPGPLAEVDVVFEQYRYDALGRRYAVRTFRACATGDVDEFCNLQTFRRTIWDGDRELMEMQVPVRIPRHSFESAAVQDSDRYVASYSVTAGHDYNPYFGRVLYIPGLALDQPLGIDRYNYSNRTVDSTGYIDSLLVMPTATMSLLWDQKGRLGFVWCSTGQERCKGSRTNGDSARQVVNVPENYFFVDRPRFQNFSWEGTLLVDKEDGTHTNFRRNRYYDPTSGRFTQEDPIGLAGGLNLYGFAGGDPVNFSDPFGLCVEPASCALALVAGTSSLTISASGVAVTAAGAAVAGIGTAAGAGIYSVYQSISEGKSYYGITNDIARRASEHLRGPHSMSIEGIVGGLTKADARGVEQVLIEARGLRKDGGDLLNQINSVAPTRENYDALKARGREILNSIGFDIKKQ